MGDFSVDYVEFLIFILLGFKRINQSETCNLYFSIYGFFMLTGSLSIVLNSC